MCCGNRYQHIPKGVSICPLKENTLLQVYFNIPFETTDKISIKLFKTRLSLESQSQQMLITKLIKLPSHRQNHIDYMKPINMYFLKLSICLVKK